MKRYLTKRARRAAPYLAAVAVTAAMFTPQMIDAQDASDKIKLMAETLRARDSGNLVLAKEKAEELIKIAPNDENVQRLNASINREIERQQAEGGAVYGQAATATVETAMGDADASSAAVSVDAAGADSLADQVAAEQAAKVAAAEQAMHILLRSSTKHSGSASPPSLPMQISTVGAYIHYGAGAAMSDPRAIDLSRVKRGKVVGDPLYAIVSTKQ